MFLRIPLNNEALGLKININNSVVRKHLMVFFSPYVTEEKEFCICFDIDININKKFVPAFRKGTRRRHVVLYNRLVSIIEQHDLCLVQDPGVFTCILRKNGYIYLQAKDEQTACIEGRVLVRACMEYLLFSRGWILFHAASAISPDGKGIIIVGDKGSGKTTILMNLLENGFRYVANDRMFINFVKKEKIRVLNRPSFIRIGRKTILGLSKLDKPIINNTYKIDSKGKVCILGCGPHMGIKISSKAEIKLLIIANIFRTSHLLSKTDVKHLLYRCIISDVPGLDALKCYFPYHRRSFSYNQIIRLLLRIPTYIQSDIHYYKLINYINNL